MSPTASADGVIEVLPDHVVDQIAAGEVVERPASVVKELVENALDAGARTITVEVEAGGRTLVRVVDDGSGMSPGDARRALSRHATSKLRSVDDLHDIATMGFRGEALPSIASVSRMTLTSRRRDDLAAIRIVIEGGKVLDVSEVGAPVGTTFEVRELLYNVPARLKFLKGEATEASHVTDAVTRLAMAHAQVHFRLRHGGRTAIDAPPCATGFDRVRALLGPRLAERLHAVSGEEGGVRVAAYLAAPELAQTTGRGVQLYVGRRSVRDRGLSHALAMGYGELVPRGRYPVAVVFVDCPAGVVDVNVHPQKLEVRFSDAQAVAAAVRHVVRRGVAQAPWLDESAGASPVQMHAVTAMMPPGPPPRASDLAASYAAQAGRLRMGTFSPPPAQATLDLAARRGAAEPVAATGSWADRMRAAISARGGRGAEAPRVVRASPGAPGQIDGDGREELRHDGRDDDAVPEDIFRAAAAPVAAGAAGAASALGSGAVRTLFEEAAPAAPSPDLDAEPVPEPVADANTVPTGVPTAGARPARAPFFSQLRYLGQLDRTYLICEGSGEMVLIDQHAAHERVEFQRLRERSDARDVPVQRLLFPTTVEVAPGEVAVAADAGDLLAAAGFEVEPFGGNTVAIKAVPAGLRHAEPAEVLRELLADLADRGGSRAVDARLDHVLATIACHSVVRAGDLLTPREAEALLASMDGVDFRAHCPHGRPVLLRMGIGEIARRFGR